MGVNYPVTQFLIQPEPHFGPIIELVDSPNHSLKWLWMSILMGALGIMSKEFIETFYGKRSKFTVVKHKETFGGVSFTIEKDGQRYRGSFSRLSDAVEAAKEEANK